MNLQPDKYKKTPKQQQQQQKTMRHITAKLLKTKTNKKILSASRKNVTF